MNRTEAAETIRSLADRYEQSEIALLRKLCSIDCSTGNVEGNGKVIALLAEFFDAAGIPHETVDAGKLGRHFVARIVPASPKGKIILNAHIDTVFHPGDAEKNPVRLDEEGWLHGCGVSDCKGGVVISASAVKICKELQLLPNYEIAMVYNCDEETGSPEGQKLFLREAENASCVYAFEPSRDEDGVLTARMGHAACHLEVFGKQAHPAMYWNGASASECLIKLCAKLYERRDREMQDIYFNIANVDSGPAGIMSPHASAEISFRINDNNPFQRTKAVLEEIFSHVPVKGCSVRYDIQEIFPQMTRCPANVRMYEHIRDIGREFMNWDLPEQGTYGSGDAAFFSKLGIPSVCGLGAYMSGPHSLNEKCRVDSIKKRTILTALTLAFFDGSVLNP